MPTQGSGRPDWTLSHSSIAQSVEHAAVNRRVVGSSPTWGAKESRYAYAYRLFFRYFIDSDQRQAAPNLFANLAETVRRTVS